MEETKQPEPRLSVSHSITRTGKLEVHPNGMAKPKVRRHAPGYNSWIRLIDTLNYYKK